MVCDEIKVYQLQLSDPGQSARSKALDFGGYNPESHLRCDVLGAFQI